MNITNDDPGGYYPVGNYGYSVGISLSILFFIAILFFASYICNHRERRRRQQRATTYRTYRESEDVCISLGLDEDVISRYPKISYAQASEEQGNKGSNLSCCYICLGDYNSNDVFRLLPECNHYFHVECIDTWLRLHANCPVCRTSPMPTTPIPTPLVEAVPSATIARSSSQL